MANKCKALELELDKILADHELKLEALGEKIRTQAVIPFCKRYGFTFESGMGSWCFFKGSKNYGPGYCSDAFMHSRAGKAMAVMFHLLSTNTDHVNGIGQYVAVVSDEDLL